MKKAVFLLVLFAMAAFGQSSPADRGFTVIDLPSWTSLAGDGEGGFCGISTDPDPSVNRWQAGQVETLVRESELGGAKFNSTSAISSDKETEYRKIICLPNNPPWFLAYSVRILNREVTGLFSNKTKLLSPLQTIKVLPIGQSVQSDKIFVGGVFIDCSAGRCYMASWISDKDDWNDLHVGVLELRQPLPQTFTLLWNSKETRSQFRAYGPGCTSGTGYWVTMAKSSKDLKTSLVYFSRTGKMTVVKDINSNIDTIPVGCDVDGVVMPYPENGVLKISRFNESQPTAEIPLMTGNAFAGYKLTNIVSLKVLDDGTIYFISETDKGNVLFRLAPKSAVPEVVKAPGEKPDGVPQNIVLSGNTIGVHQTIVSFLGVTHTNFLLTREPFIANLRAEPATIEPGQPVKISWDLAGQAISMALTPTPGDVTYTGPGHYEATAYPSVTTTYTVSVGWVGGPPITKSITVTVLLPPVPPPKIQSVTNGASFDQDQPLAPGAIFSLFGKNLGAPENSKGWPLPRKLGGAKVTICGVDAPLFANTGPMTRADGGGQLWQINGVVPLAASFQSSCEVVIAVDQKPPMTTLTVKGSIKISSKPEETLALFTFTGFHPNGAQTQEPIITNQQGQFIAPPGVSIPGANPAMFTQAKACEVISLWSTGGGGTIPRIADGEPAPSEQLAWMETRPVVQIYGVDAEVLFAGLAPGFAGLNQINVRIPCEATSGKQWLWFGRPPALGKVYKIWIHELSSFFASI